MHGFKEHLTEFKAPEVNISQRLLSDLSSDAQYAIRSWEMANWTTGDLEKAYKTKNDLHDEIESKAEEIRAVLRRLHGSKMTLYRGIKKGHDTDFHSGRTLFSWTSRKEVAALFAGLATGNGPRNIKLNKNRKTSGSFLFDLTDQQIQQIQDKVLRTGRAIYKNLLFKTSPADDKYFEAYKKTSRGYSFYNDDLKTNLAGWLIRTRDEEKSFQKEVSAQGSEDGYVVTSQVPIQDIVWVLNNGKVSGTLEYIVKGNSGMKSKRVEL